MKKQPRSSKAEAAEATDANAPAIVTHATPAWLTWIGGKTTTARGAALPPAVMPYISFGLIGFLVLIYIAELAFAVTPPTDGFTPSARTLFALGGLQFMLTIEHGQLYRIFSGPLLHANFLHIFSNGLALLAAGYALEREAGRLWFAALFVIGGLGGACGSLLLNDHAIVTVGASGAIMGLLAAALVISCHYADGEERAKLRRGAIRILLPSLLPTAAMGSVAVDLGAHFGGAVAGAAASYALCRVWRGTDALPGLRKAALGIIAVGLLGTVTAGVAIALNYHNW